MKKISVLLILFLTVTICFGQIDFDPKVIVLMPKSVKIEKGLEKQIEFYERYGINFNKKYLIEKRDSLLEIISSNASIPLNYKEHYKNQIEFAPFLIFENKISQDYASSFHEILNVDLENSLAIIDRKESFNNLDSMRLYSEANSVDYLINILEVKVSRYDKDNLMIKPIFAFYDNTLKKVIDINLNINDGYNKSKITVADTVLKIYFDDIDERIFMTRYIKNHGTNLERKILKERTDVLHHLINIGKDNLKIKRIIKNSDSEFPISNLYTTFISQDGNNFLAIFINVALQEKYDSVVYAFGNRTSSDNNWKIQRKWTYLVGKGKLDDKKIIADIFKRLINKYFNDNSTEFNKEFWSD